MNTYKIKSIFKTSILIEYRKDNGTLTEFQLTIEPDWNKERIEQEIALAKINLDKQDINLHLDKYFSKGEELEFVTPRDENEILEEELKRQEEIERLHLEEENKKLLELITNYRNTPVDYVGARWQEYPTFEEQLDALYWMRQGVTEPIEEIDKKIKEIKEKYPKGKPTNLTLGYLDDTIPNRPTEYKDDLRSRNIQADFL